MTDLLQTLQKELSDLQLTRDELKGKLSTAKTEAMGEWKKLEDRFGEAEIKLKALKDQAKEPALEVAETAKNVIKELKDGYERVRKHF